MKGEIEIRNRALVCEFCITASLEQLPEQILTCKQAKQFYEMTGEEFQRPTNEFEEKNKQIQKWIWTVSKGQQDILWKKCRCKDHLNQTATIVTRLKMLKRKHHQAV